MLRRRSALVFAKDSQHRGTATHAVKRHIVSERIGWDRNPIFVYYGESCDCCHDVSK
jgi:hypothetical protein